MARMQALLAHTGPLVHVDHSHRLTGSEDATDAWYHYRPWAKNPYKNQPKQTVAEELSEIGIEMGMLKRRLLDLANRRRMTGMDQEDLLYLAETLGLPSTDKSMRAELTARLETLVAMAVEGYPPSLTTNVKLLVRDIGALAARRAALESA